MEQDFQCDVSTARRLLAGELAEWPTPAAIGALAFQGFSKQVIEEALGLPASPEKTEKTIRSHAVSGNGIDKRRWF